MDDVAKSFYNSLRFIKDSGGSVSGFENVSLPVAESTEEARAIMNGPGKADGLSMAESVKKAFDFMDNLRQAKNGSVYQFENDQSKAASQTGRYRTKNLDPFMDVDVADNYNNLNELLNSFDNAATLEKKNSVLNNYLDQNSDMSDARKTFVNFLGEMINNPQPWPANEASKRMRTYLNDVRRRFYRLS